METPTRRARTPVFRGGTADRADRACLVPVVGRADRAVVGRTRADPAARVVHPPAAHRTGRTGPRAATVVALRGDRPRGVARPGGRGETHHPVGRGTVARRGVLGMLRHQGDIRSSVSWPRNTPVFHRGGPAAPPPHRAGRDSILHRRSAAPENARETSLTRLSVMSAVSSHSKDSAGVLTVTATKALMSR